MVRCFRPASDAVPTRRGQIVTIVSFALVLAVGGCGGGDDDVPATASRSGADERSAPVTATTQDTVAAPADAMLAGESAVAAQTVSAPPADPEPQDAESVPVVPDTDRAAAPSPRGDVPHATTTAAESLGPYCLQLGSFRNPAYAEQRLARLSDSGVHAVIEVATVEGITYHRVCVPNLPDLAAAQRLGDTLYSEYGFAYLVRKE
jgi:cell division protein FtsN